MARCIFENLTTKQALALSSWFEGHGEQDADEWFEMRKVPSILTDIHRKGGYEEVLPNGDVIVYCRTVR